MSPYIPVVVLILAFLFIALSLAPLLVNQGDADAVDPSPQVGTKASSYNQ